jgi:hypothetical protein
MVLHAGCAETEATSFRFAPGRNGRSRGCNAVYWHPPLHVCQHCHTFANLANMPDCLNTLIDNDLRDERGMFAIFAKGHMPRWRMQAQNQE